MSLKTILFAGLFAVFAVGALFNPVLGILGYMLHYTVGPERQWWHAPLSPLGMRYSLTLAVMTAIGIAMNRHRLKFGELLTRQEKLALLMLGLIWVLTLAGPETVDRYTITDHASVKMTKVMIFCLMMTHVVTRQEDLDKVFWALVVGSLVLGLQGYDLPRRAFTHGRLDARVGGSDFRDANALAVFLVAAVPMIGVTFMRTAWRGKLLCLAAGVFACNGIVLCRSRGALLALLGAAFAMILTASRRYRLKLLAGAIVAGAGLLYLADPQFLARMGKIVGHATAVAEGSQSSDRSTMMRVEAWRGGLKMIRDNPLGVGPGNFNQNIGRYSPSVAGLSPHSLYIQCAAELGVAGFLLLLVILGNAWWTVWTMIRKASQLPEPQRAAFRWSACALAGSVAAFATCGLTGHVLYREAFWWYMLMPVCLRRTLANLEEDTVLLEEEKDSLEPADVDQGVLVG